MIKRPLNPRFNKAVFEGRKFTTIRAKAWPIGIPIMLFNWTGKPYRSKHSDVCPVIVEETMPIKLSRSTVGNIFETSMVPRLCKGKPLYESEGFDCIDDFHDWFRPLIKPCETIERSLIQFRLAEPK